MGKRTGLGGAASVAIAAALLVAGCSSSDDTSSSEAAETTTTMAAEPIRVLVTNDDGYDAEGIDALVTGLQTVPGVEVTVVAPATNQSGKGSSTTEGQLTVTDATTKSGYPVKAVAGTPADTIIWAIDQKGIDVTPDLVISGINAGQNMGPAVALSGTVGAARAAAARGIPAVATSQGPLTPPQGFPASVDQVLAWLQQNMAAIADGTLPTTTITNLNAPTCPTGKVRGSVDVPVAAVADGYNDTPDCASTATAPADDIAAYLAGFTPQSELTATAGSPT